MLELGIMLLPVAMLTVGTVATAVVVVWWERQIRHRKRGLGR